MRSTYKKLGPHIREVDVRNVEDRKTNLLGVSTQKVFIESIANTIGTNFTKYKIVKRGQFTYVPDTSRRGDKIGLALLETHDWGLVSNVYTVFEIIDEDQLLPEYLMMWFRRPEFDRYARFKSHGSVRELFGWAEMCDVELPIPAIEKQREIVKEYRTVVNRIRLNERLNQKLEEAAQAIYKQWFVEFEFPMTAEYAKSIGKPELAGQPYKSSGGEMEYNEVLEQEIPKGWKNGPLEEFGKIVTGKTPSSDTPEHFGQETPFVTPSDFSSYFFHAVSSERALSKIGVDALTKKLIPPGSILTTCIGSDMGKTMMTRCECVTNQQINSVIPHKKETWGYLFHALRNMYKDLRNLAIGSSTMPLLNKTEFSAVECLCPAEGVGESFQHSIEKLHDVVWCIERDAMALRAFCTVLLSSLATRHTE